MSIESALAKLLPGEGDKWGHFSFSIKGGEEIGEKIQTIIGYIKTALEIQKAIVDILSTLAIDLLDLESLAIKTAFEALESVIDEFLKEDAKVHALIIPPRKEKPFNIPSDAPMPQLETSWEINDTFSDEAKQSFNKLLEAVGRYDQGNYGYARTVIESLADQFDANRPQYNKNAAVFSIVILAGAQAITELYNLLNSLHRLFGTSLKGNSLIPTTLTKTPQDLKATLIAGPEKTNMVVQLEWKNPPPLQVLTEYQGTRVRIDELAIIRSEDDETLKAKNWGDIFFDWQPDELSEDERSKDNITDFGFAGSGTHTKILKIFAYDGIRDTYIDTDDDLENDQDYYYFVAYRYSLAKPPPSEKNEVTYVKQPYQQISNVVPINLETDNGRDKKVASSKKGVKPDWISHPNILDVFPAVRYWIEYVKTFITSLRSFATGAGSALRSYVDFINAEIERYETYADELQRLIAQISFTMPAGGIWYTIIESSEGGTDFFKQELLRRLSDESDATAPPFFKSGVTAGVVLFAGAPNPANLQSVKDLVSLFTETDPQTPFQAATAAIDKAVTTIEKTFEDADFDDNINTYIPYEGTPEEIEAGENAKEEATQFRVAKKTEHNRFDDALNPIDPDDLDALLKTNIPFDP